MTANKRIMELEPDKKWRVRFIYDGSNIGHRSEDSMISIDREEIAKKVEWISGTLPAGYLLIYHIYRELDGKTLLIYMKEQNVRALVGQ